MIDSPIALFSSNIFTANITNPVVLIMALRVRRKEKSPSERKWYTNRMKTRNEPPAVTDSLCLAIACLIDLNSINNRRGLCVKG